MRNLLFTNLAHGVKYSPLAAGGAHSGDTSQPKRMRGVLVDAPHASSS